MRPSLSVRVGSNETEGLLPPGRQRKGRSPLKWALFRRRSERLCGHVSGVDSRVMKIVDEIIEAAFGKYDACYASMAARGWRVKDRVAGWEEAHCAFDQGSFDDFNKLYDTLRQQWQVFRGAPASERWSSKEAFDQFMEFPRVWRARRLCELIPANADPCRELLKQVQPIKRLKQGESVVAISKFLHFWNPKLFVIVDRAAMWQWVFGHAWLREQVAAFARNLVGLELGSPPDQCDLQWYLGILFWSAEVLRNNPPITQHFATYVRGKSEGFGGDLPMDTYEAAAMEWFLLGLVELSPAGVRPT